MSVTIASIGRRLAAAEKKLTTQATGSLAQRIHQARKNKQVPTHTKAELEVIAAGNGIEARIARGWLRICFTAGTTTGNPAINPDNVLPAMAGYFYDKPLEFVLFSYDWGHDRSLRVVRLPDEIALIRYDSEFGPDQWACDLFDSIGEQVQLRGFDGEHAVEAIRMAVSSGHGIGKSAITAWLVNWIMSTRPNARGVVTANTAPQLESKTWSEIAKWSKRSLTGQWFDVNTGRGAMRMVASEAPESWRCDAQTCREENSESFAGLHAADSTPFYIFDEASAIPAKIFEVAQGGMTDGEPMIFAFGNPTRNSGWFFEAFNGQRHRWIGKQIDSREVQITNKATIDEWVQDYGEDSDFVRVRVRGVFPRAASMQFISSELVFEAQNRDVGEQRHEAAIVGVDVARFGGDQSVIRTRLGRDARGFKPIKLRGVDLMTLASKVGEHINYLRGLGLRVVCFVDGGGVGGGVIDRLRQMGYPVQEVQFGGKASDPKRYLNKRAEMWGVMREWLAIGEIEKDEALATDMCSIEYGFTNSDQIQLEKKSDMKARGLASPDDADALALTFAFPVAMILDVEGQADAAKKRREYDPFARVEKQMERARI
jgi:hypothetical protein